MSHKPKIVADFINNKIEFVTTVPCKQLAGVIEKIDAAKSIFTISPQIKKMRVWGSALGLLWVVKEVPLLCRIQPLA